MKKKIQETKIRAIRHFPAGIICGPHRESFAVRDHLRSNLGIISGLGIICGRVYLRRCTMNFCYTCHLSFWQTCKNTSDKHSTLVSTFPLLVCFLDTFFCPRNFASRDKFYVEQLLTHHFHIRSSVGIMAGNRDLVNQSKS